MTKQDARFFSDTANCYAFAVKCANPTGKGQARPGGVASKGDLQEYVDALKQGVLTDGGAKVKHLGTHSVQSITEQTIPKASAEWYLIALLVNENGFHFVRRQRKKFSGTPFWKWKEGNHGKEERNAYDPVAKDYVRVTDAQLPSLVKGKFVTDVAGWQFKTLCFFEVQKAGYEVTNS